MNPLLIGTISFILFAGLVLLAASLGRPYLFSLSVAFILISNITVQLTIEILPGVTISWAIVIYSLVYLITDLVIEFYGATAGYRLALTNLAAQMILWTYVWLSSRLPLPTNAASIDTYNAMNSLFGTTSRVSIAAIIASLGPFADIAITGKIREWLKRAKVFDDGMLGLIARTKLSTFLGESVNTVLFFSISLWGTESTALLWILASATLTKWAISAADAPFLWLFFKLSEGPPDAISAKARKAA